MVQRRPFSDRYVFAKVMQDNPDLSKELIERVLGLEVGSIRSLQVEATAASVLRRSVRFDVFMDSDVAAFEVEMQTYEQKDLPKRMRYYRSQLDRLLLNKGASYEELKPVYVIFICVNDPFGRGLPVYTFKNRCDEDPSIRFDDDATNVVLCASGDLTKASPDIASLLNYIGTDTVSTGDPLTSKLQEAVVQAYHDEEWVSDMSWLDWDIQDARREAERVGLAEGREKGREEGREEAYSRQRDLIAAMERAGASAGEIVAALKGTELDHLYEKYGVSSSSGASTA